MNGCIHIYCGDGKGKTSAALGLAVRAAGRGKQVLLVRFLKSDDSGEIPVLNEISGITVIPCDRSFGFVFSMTDEMRKEAACYYQNCFEAVCKQAVEEHFDVLIMDELMAACNYGMVLEADILCFLKNKPSYMEVIMTGREPSEAICEMADYVSEIKMIKHPYTKGIPAREGIEY